MLGVLVNALAILAGGSVGLLAKKGIPEKITNAIMTAIALCVIYIGVSGMLKGENTLVLIVSMVLGTAVGTLLDLDGVAEVLNVSRKTAYRYCKSGKLPSNSVSGQVMVSEETLLAFLHGAKPQKSAARTGQYAARGQKVEAPQFAEFPSDDLTGVRRIEGY